MLPLEPRLTSRFSLAEIEEGTVGDNHIDASDVKLGKTACNLVVVPKYFCCSLITLLGDVNLDGVVSALDIVDFISILTAGSYLEKADTNEDGVVSFLDIRSFIALLSS